MKKKWSNLKDGIMNPEQQTWTGHIAQDSMQIA